MLNGNISNIESIGAPIISEVTYSDNANDSFECQVFSLKDIHQDHSNSSGIQASPSIKILRLMNSHPKGDETSTNFTNFQSRKATEEVKSSVGTSITEFRLATINSPEGNKCIDIVMGNSPCSAYCGRCKIYVHTIIAYQDGFITKYLIKITQAFTMCCGAPEWFSKEIVHRCPYCYLILGTA